MRVIRAIKVVLFLACLTPAVLLALKLRNPIELGPNPVEMLEHTTGDWAIWFPADYSQHHPAAQADELSQADSCSAAC
jgi:hypothetical protein